MIGKKLTKTKTKKNFITKISLVATVGMRALQCGSLACNSIIAMTSTIVVTPSERE